MPSGLTPDDCAIISASSAPRRYAKGETAPVCREHQFLTTGWMCRQRRLPNGQVQIFSLFIPGDVLPASGGSGCFEYGALTAAVAQPVGGLADASGCETHIGRAIRQSLDQTQHRLFDHVVRLGQRDAYQALGHLFLELHERLTTVGLTTGCRFPFPVGQERLADFLGLSEVHVNRTLRQMRADAQLLSGPGWHALPKMQALADRVGYPLGAEERRGAA